MIKLRWTLTLVTLASCLAHICALPASLVEEIKASELRENKVKRAHDDVNRPEEHARDGAPYYMNPTAIKRGANLKNENPDQQTLSDWEQEQSMYQNRGNMASIPSTFFNTEDNTFDDKSIAEYEKGYRYGINKDKLDEALENAVLKSELYGEPSAADQYRYFGDDKKRKRRNVKKTRVDRMKREIELSPEDILTILTLYENDRQRSPNGYRTSWQRFEPTLDLDGDRDENDIEQDDENWLDTPVYPHATGHSNQFSPNYYYDDKPQIFDKRGQWGGFSDNRKKRFMVARKRNDPTRELRYLNGPGNRNDFYTLSQLLGSQRESDVPMYHRLVL